VWVRALSSAVGREAQASHARGGGLTSAREHHRVEVGGLERHTCAKQPRQQRHEVQPPRAVGERGARGGGISLASASKQAPCICSGCWRSAALQQAHEPQPKTAPTCARARLVHLGEEHDERQAVQPIARQPEDVVHPAQRAHQPPQGAGAQPPLRPPKFRTAPTNSYRSVGNA
jgi:hypothetical protein